MKKRLYLIAAAALALVACAKEEAYQPTESTIPGAKRIVLGASFELPGDPTKSDYDAAGNFTWSDDDAIWIGSNETNGDSKWGYGPIIKGQSEIGPGHATAQFDCTLFGDVTAIAAVFPKTVKPSYSAGALSLTLPATIAWTDTQLANPANATMQVDNIMVARYVDIYSGGYAHGITENIQFRNVGGLFCLTLKNVPAGADKLVFTADKKINGTFAVSNVDDSKDGNNYPVIATAATETKSEKSVTITFPTITNGENKMTFFIPVPVGSYVIGFDVQNAEAASLWAFSASRENGVERGHIVKMPTLSHVIVGGSGDGATNIITTPTGFSGTVNLPSTNNSIYVRMNQTGGTITLAYADAPALHPANVYLQALGNVETLDINLPDSHVELTGEDDVQHVITNVSSYTSYSTLKVDNKVKIGKDEDEDSGITITGGSLDLAAPVNGKVTVNIPAANNNETEEKVAINITSAIKDLVVTRAADNITPADKVYVSLGNGASVAKTISVPEVNCNLYVAPGVAVSVIETKAAENTVEGNVETLSATGASTIVTVTSEATVKTAITADDGATVIVDENATTTGATQNDNGGAGTITSVDLDSVVAYIGGNTYTTLGAAFEAVKTGETIVLQKDITQDAGFIYDKTGVGAKLNLNGYTVTVNNGANVNNRAFKINNGTIEVYGGSIVAVGSGTNSSNGAGCYGAFRVEAGGVLNAHDLELTNSRPWGLNVKVLGGTAELTNVKITSSYGGGIEVTEAGLGTHSQVGTATLTNCTFTQTGYFDHCSTALSVSGGSSLTINSGSYTSENYALYVFSSGGIITVKDGSFSGNKDGVAIVAAIDTNTYPQYTGGLQLEGGNYTGGFNITSPASMSITGGTFNVDPSDYVVEGYDAINNGNGTWTVQESAYVARIGETKYETLDAAIAAAQAEETVTLIKDVVLSESLVIAEAKNLTLDLGTHSISGAVNGKLITNNGTLTINASSSNPGKVYNTDVTAQGHDAVYNAEGATITINGGIFGDSDSDMTNDNLINRGAAIRNLGTATLNGGYYTDVNNFTPDGGVYAYAIINGGTMEINSGVTAYGKNHGNIATSGPLTVNGGTFSITGTRSYYNVYSSGDTANILGGTFTKQSGDALVTFCINDKNAVVNVYGGTFNNLNNSVFKSGEGTVSVTAGTFNKQPEAAIIADGYEAVDNGNGTWTVQELQYVAKIGDSYYATLTEAITAANNSDSPSTITMLQDVTLNTGNVRIEKEITLNLNGKTITNNAPTSRLFRVYKGVDFTIDGTVSGSSMVIPESNKSSYGFVNIDASSTGSTLTVNGGSYSGAMLNGVFFKTLGTSQTVTLNGVTCVVENGDGQKYGNMTATDINGIGGVFEAAQNSAILNVNGGVFTSYSTREKNNMPMGIFNASNATVTLEGATIISESAGGIEMSKGEITGSCISYPSGQQIHTWANAAIQLSSGSNTPVVINSGEYRGEYGINVLTSGTNAIINGGTFEGHTSALHVHGRSYDRPFEITINAGTFIGSGSGEKSVAIETRANDRTHIVINGGTFTGQLHPAATEHLSITGGTFDHDPSDYVAEGHIAVYSATTHKYTVEAAQFWEDVAVSDSEFASITDENNKIITISTAEQLAKLAKNVNAHVPQTTGFIYKGYTVKLENDIDLAGKIWTPIGVCEDWTRGHFTGTFDGQGHTISNLKVVREDRAGLFGSIYGEAVIKNLNVTNVTLIANHFAAGIVGWINEENYDLVVDNCSVIGGVITVVPNFVNDEWDNGDKCGGIVGYSNQNTANHCKITNNRAENLTITAYRDCGGIVGFCSGNVLVSGNTAKNVTLVQDNFRGYKSSVTTVQQIVGRNDGSTQENNTATGVVINTVN